MFAYSASKTSEDTFKVIFDTYKNRLYGYVLTISHSPYTAEEITQEIFMKLWICREALSSIDNIDGYLFAMARNKTFNHLRKANQQEQVLQDMKAAMLTSMNETEDQAAVSDLERLLNEALTRLSPQRRLVYQLSRQQGMNHEQIAIQLKLSKNTVKNHMVDALHFIKNYLQQRDIITSFLFVLLFL
ncbi:MAG: RNA polymerase sigma-70 factor [Chitinophagaceae bacterium]